MMRHGRCSSHEPSNHIVGTVLYILSPLHFGEMAAVVSSTVPYHPPVAVVLELA